MEQGAGDINRATLMLLLGAAHPSRALHRHPVSWPHTSMSACLGRAIAALLCALRQLAQVDGAPLVVGRSLVVVHT